MEMKARHSVMDEDAEALLGADAAAHAPETPRDATRRRAGWWPRCAAAVVAFGLAAYAAGSRAWIVADETVSFKNDGEAHELRLRVGLDAVSYAHVTRKRFNVVGETDVDARAAALCGDEADERNYGLAPAAGFCDDIARARTAARAAVLALRGGCARCAGPASAD